MKITTPAILALEDGSVFYGTAIGHSGTTVGEVVFNTAMTGYQEVLTDPSYAKQLVTLTHPSIGNTGINNEDIESNAIQVAGLIIRNLSKLSQHWQSVGSLEDYLKANNTIGIANIDTRALTHKLRDKGALRGCIINTLSKTQWENAEEKAHIVAQAITQAKHCPSLQQTDLASFVSTASVYRWDKGSAWLNVTPPTSQKKYHVVVYDYGVKHTLLRSLVNRGCTLTVVPAKTAASKVLALKPDGVVLSNGPGDPLACDYAIDAIKTLLEKSIPLLGICLGQQLLALACGARTYKMKFGQHGINHPVKSLTAKQAVFITSQNHGFAVDKDTLPPTLIAQSEALFDNTLQGIAHTAKPALGFQGHPEGSPGPHDIQPIFDQFIKLMDTHSVTT